MKIKLLDFARTFICSVCSSQHSAKVEENKFLKFAAPGSFYSPIPSLSDLVSEGQDVDVKAIAEVNFRSDEQLRLVEEFSGFYRDFVDSCGNGLKERFHLNQEFFCFSDAFYLQSMIRRFRPGRIIEIGSGFSSALMLDTCEKYSTETELVFVEPYSERLASVLKANDYDRITLIEKPVQHAGIEISKILKKNDFLFIDSSHVSKYRSDLNYLLFDVIPRLRSSVIVHFHDIFFPFEYPLDWLSEGRAWNEAYVVRAFLMYNLSWQVLLFSDLLGRKNRSWVEERFPRCLENTGGSLWIQRI